MFSGRYGARSVAARLMPLAEGIGQVPAASDERMDGRECQPQPHLL